MLRERDLIEACKRHDAYAQKALYEHFLPLAHSICKRYISDSAEREDIVQEGFIKVFMNIKTFRSEGSFEGWLRRIFVNASINHVLKRKHSRYEERLDDNIHLSENTNTENDLSFYGNEMDMKDINKNKVNFELVSAADFSKKELMDALSNLPESFRIVFSLFCIDGIGHEEIAGMLKIDHATSRTRLNRARAMLQKLLYEKSIEKIAR